MAKGIRFEVEVNVSNSGVRMADGGPAVTARWRREGDTKWSEDMGDELMPWGDATATTFRDEWLMDQADLPTSWPAPWRRRFQPDPHTNPWWTRLLRQWTGNGELTDVIRNWTSRQPENDGSETAFVTLQLEQE
jgi:hypothetical protein